MIKYQIMCVWVIKRGKKKTGLHIDGLGRRKCIFKSIESKNCMVGFTWLSVYSTWEAGFSENVKIKYNHCGMYLSP